MILIDMPMPKNCGDCPACNEYLTCAISVNGRGWGENDVIDYYYGQSRPEWCPLKEQEPMQVKTDMYGNAYCPWCSTDTTIEMGARRLHLGTHFCPYCGKAVKWDG